MSTDLLWRIDELRALIDTVFPVEDVLFDGGRPAFAVRRTAGASLAALRTRLEPAGYVPALRRRRGRDVILVLPAPPQTGNRWAISLLLFVATLGTTLAIGYLQAIPLVDAGMLRSAVGGALGYALPLMGILLTHELAHKVVAVRRGISASLPYFIPMPIPPVGTLGAIIVTRSPAPDRDSLMELGASGPIAGFLAAIPVLVYGIRHSFVIAPGAISMSTSFIPDPLLVRWLTALVLHPPQGHQVLAHPAFLAGWFGLLVTSLNLLPSGMLDGGHAVRSLFGPDRHRLISYAGVLAALALGYLPMAVLLLLMIPRGHPGPLDDVTPLTRSRVAVGVALVAIFILSAVPLWPAILQPGR